MATYRVSNQAQLDAVIMKVKGGDSVLMLSGNYTSLSLVNKAFTSAVTFVSESATAPANIAFAKAYNSSNVVFKNLSIGRALNPAVDKEWTNIAQVEYSTNVTFDGVKFSSTGADASYLGRGLFVRGGSNVTVQNSDFSHLAVGMTTMSMSGINILSNKFHDVRIDGVELTAVAGGKIDANDFRDFRSSPTAHPDAIQVWTSGTGKPTTDLLISNNVILPGTGGGGQGIFIQDEVGNAPHQRITIRNNLVLDAGNYYNGITVRGGKDIVVEGNTSISPTTDTKNFWIRLDNVQGAVVKNNLADQLVQNNTTNITQSGNIFLNLQKSFATKISGINSGSLATVSSLIVPGVGYQIPSTTSTQTSLSSSSTLLAPSTTTTMVTTLAAPTLADTLTPIATAPVATSSFSSPSFAKPMPAAPLTLNIAAPVSPSELMAAARNRRFSFSIDR